MLKFLSFLGTSRYIPCNYFMKDLKAENCCYIQEALLSMLEEKNIKPDEVVIFTTDKSYEENWIKNKNTGCGRPGLKETLDQFFVERSC